MTVRSAAAGDAARIAELSAQLGYPVTAGEVNGRLEAIRGMENHEFSVASLPGGEIVGWVHLYVRRVVMSDPMVEVDGLVVDERHRRTGIGRRLMDHAEEWARKRGIGSVNLRSNEIRKGAHAFYERLGYELAKRQTVFRKVIR
ncbi:MAG TPA: GNAT family N-acetyltransferase [Patescibacteria group bacterium]|nr:GNAT family N-acetyltransferase [Patescibacteria group bacterium]